MQPRANSKLKRKCKARCRKKERQTRPPRKSENNKTKSDLNRKSRRGRKNGALRLKQ